MEEPIDPSQMGSRWSRAAEHIHAAVAETRFGDDDAGPEEIRDRVRAIQNLRDLLRVADTEMRKSRGDQARRIYEHFGNRKAAAQFVGVTPGAFSTIVRKN